jgi:hypothetical protein
MLSTGALALIGAGVYSEGMRKTPTTPALIKFTELYEAHLAEAIATNHNKVAFINVDLGDRPIPGTKPLIESDFFMCGFVWLQAYPGRAWKKAKELGLEKAYEGWTHWVHVPNGKFTLAEDAAHKALSEATAIYPELAICNVHTRLD